MWTSRTGIFIVTGMLLFIILIAASRTSQEDLPEFLYQQSPTDGAGDRVDISINVDSVSKDQILHTGIQTSDGSCNMNTRTLDIEGTLSGNEMSEEINLQVNAKCQLVVESINREYDLSESATGTSQSNNYPINTFAWTIFRLYGDYAEDDTEYLDVETETEVQFHLSETASGFSFNYPLPDETCEAYNPVTSWDNCWLEYEHNTQQRKAVGAYGDFTHVGSPLFEWEQSATFDARTSQTDTYRCIAGEHPAYLQVFCRGDRDPE